MPIVSVVDETSPPGRRAHLLSLLGGICALAAVCWVIWFGWRTAGVADTVDQTFRESSGRPEAYRPGGIFTAKDSYTWLGYTQDQREAGTWRMPRMTWRDNAPHGREVHWSSPFLWLLRGAAEIRGWGSDLTFEQALEHGAVWTGPSLLLLVTIGGGGLIARRYGLLAAGAFAATLAAQSETMIEFHPLRPDHQSLYGATIILSMIFLLAGGLGTTVHSEDARAQWRRRCWFATAGLLGALGMWVSATVTAGVQLAFVASVGLVALWRHTHPSEPERYDPGVWRIWGWTGGLACVAAWLVEYAPALPWGRLEVNHPLYALQWVAAGEALRLWTGWRWAGESWTRHRRAALAGWVAATAALPLLIVLGPAELHAMRDPLMQAIHQHIVEFKTYAEATSAQPVRYFLGSFRSLAVPLLLAPALLLLRRNPKCHPRELAALWVLSIVLLALGMAQARWMAHFAAVLALLAAATVSAMLSGGRRGSRIMAAAAVLLMLANLGHLGFVYHKESRKLDAIEAGRRIDPGYLTVGYQKLLSIDLARHRGTADWLFLAGPDQAPLLHYFARIPAVSSLYWENAAGIRATHQFLSDPTGETALAIARERGITHILVHLHPGSAEIPRTMDGAESLEAWDPDGRRIINRIIFGTAALPSWIVPDSSLAHLVNRGYAYQDQTFRPPFGIYRVRPAPAQRGP